MLQTLTFQLTSEFSYTQLANIEEPLTAKEKESENAQYSLSFFFKHKTHFYSQGQYKSDPLDCFSVLGFLFSNELSLLSIVS